MTHPRHIAIATQLEPQQAVRVIQRRKAKPMRWEVSGSLSILPGMIRRAGFAPLNLNHRTHNREL